MKIDWSKLHVKTMLKIAFHTVGVGCIFASVFLQMIVFVSIAQNGRFVAVEPRRQVLMFELGMTGIAAAYAAYMFVMVRIWIWRAIRRDPSMKHEKDRKEIEDLAYESALSWLRENLTIKQGQKDRHEDNTTDDMA